MFIDAINKSPLSSIITIHEENAGLHFLMEISTEMTDEALEHSAAEAGIGISCLSKYYRHPDAAKQHVVVLNYSGVERERMDEAMKRLSRCLKNPD